MRGYQEKMVIKKEAYGNINGQVNELIIQIPLGAMCTCHTKANNIQYD